MRVRLWRKGTVRWYWALLWPCLFYLGAANGFLNSIWLLEAVNAWRGGHLDYRFALTWFPGRVRVYGARTAYGLSVTIEPGARLSLESAAGGLVARVEEARAGAAGARGVLWPGRGRSAWLLSLGPFAVGLETKRSGSRWILHRAKRWFEKDGAILTGDGSAQAQAGPVRGRLLRGGGL